MPEDGLLEQPPIPPPSGPAAPLQDGGVLEEPPIPPPVLQQPSTEGAPLPLTRGQDVLPQDGILQQQQQPPTDQRAAEPPATTEPATVEEEQPVPVCQGLCVPTECPEGRILNEETGFCVLEEQEAVEEPEEQSEETVAGEPEVEQPSEEEQPEPKEDQPSGDSNSEPDSESEDNDNN